MTLATVASRSIPHSTRTTAPTARRLARLAADDTECPMSRETDGRVAANRSSRRPLEALDALLDGVVAGGEIMLGNLPPGREPHLRKRLEIRQRGIKIFGALRLPNHRRMDSEAHHTT